MNHWWVNQNQTYKHELEGGYLWSPKTKADGSHNPFYDSMTETRPGDVVFSFCDTYIKAVGVVTGPYQSAPKPTEFGSTGSNWGAEGWYVPVQYLELDRPIRPKDYMSELRPTLPKKYSPLQTNGNGNQGVYLTHVPDAMATVLRQLLSGQVQDVEASKSVESDPAEEQEQHRIDQDRTISETVREQLTKARVGQGVFKSRVELLEPACRVTGVSDRRFLRASHIKPWCKSNNEEKLDGNNGLMLAPHIDHLFDRGFISFDDDGSLLISKHLPTNVLQAWHIDEVRKRLLTSGQAAYMSYHRKHVFAGR